MKRKRSRLMSFEARNKCFGYIFVLPLIIGLCLFIPNLVQTIIFSFNTINVKPGGYSLDFVGWNYYWVALNEDPKFIRLMTEFLQDLGTRIPVILIFSLFIATILNQKFRGKMFAQTVFFIPVLLATGIVAKVETSIDMLSYTSTIGESSGGTAFETIAGWLGALGVGESLLNVVLDAVKNIYSVVQSSGIQIFIFMAGLQDIPDYIYEAAKIDGCSGWESFWKITFPSILPQIAVNFIYTTVDSYTQPNVELFNYLHSLAFTENRYGLATAMHMIYFVVIAVILLIIFGIYWYAQHRKERQRHAF